MATFNVTGTRLDHPVQGLQAALADRLVGARARNADGEQQHGCMDEVAPVAAAVSPDEPEKRPGRAGAAHELVHDRCQDERREGVGEQPRRGRAEAGCDQGDAGHGGDSEWNEEHAAKCPKRRPPPGDERADPHQQQERQPEAVQEEVVVGLRHGTRLAAQRLGEEWIRHAPEDGQAERDEQQVVVEKGRLARDQRLELRPCTQQRQA